MAASCSKRWEATLRAASAASSAWLVSVELRRSLMRSAIRSPAASRPFSLSAAFASIRVLASATWSSRLSWWRWRSVSRRSLTTRSNPVGERERRLCGALAQLGADLLAALVERRLDRRGELVAQCAHLIGDRLADLTAKLLRRAVDLRGRLAASALKSGLEALVEGCANLLAQVDDLPRDRVAELVAQRGDRLLAPLPRLRAVGLELLARDWLDLAEARRDLIRERDTRRGGRRTEAILKLGLELVDPAVQPTLDVAANVGGGRGEVGGRALDRLEDAPAQLGANGLDLVGERGRGVAQAFGQAGLNALLGVDHGRLQPLADHGVGLAQTGRKAIGEFALDGFAAATEVALDLGADRGAHLLEGALVLRSQLAAARGKLLGEDRPELLSALVEAPVKLGRKAWGRALHSLDLALDAVLRHAAGAFEHALRQLRELRVEAARLDVELLKERAARLLGSAPKLLRAAALAVSFHRLSLDLVQAVLTRSFAAGSGTPLSATRTPSLGRPGVN
jgi:hypothetical protein